MGFDNSVIFNIQLEEMDYMLLFLFIMYCFCLSCIVSVYHVLFLPNVVVVVDPPLLRVAVEGSDNPIS